MTAEYDQEAQQPVDAYRPKLETTPTGNLSQFSENTAVHATAAPSRNHLIAFLGEFFGTFIFMWCAFVIAQIANLDATIVSPVTGSNPSRLVMISLGFGFSVMMAVFMFYRISGANFNPAVTVTLMLAQAVSPLRGVIMIIAQFIGAIAASAAAWAMVPGEMKFRNELGGGCSIARGLFIEAFVTTILCLTVLLMAVEKHKATFMAPFAIGIALFIGNMASIHFSGAGINPARSFGPDAVNGTFTHYHWIYWLGPFIGSFVAFGIWKLFKFLDYETCNPGQDADH
ncbi:aquaporin [Scheffersomyces coipomensis]|uniref:aquaporin n=1 Tax=Scheffersomyces coipomensis TaxID=1788519 RepID=UPI00315D5530